MDQIKVVPGRVPYSINAGNDGSVFSNAGPDTVYYGTSSVTSAASVGSIASGATATLTGTQYLAVAPTASTSFVSIVSSFPEGPEGGIANNDIAPSAAIALSKLATTGALSATSLALTAALTGATTGSFSSTLGVGGAATFTKASGTGVAVTADQTIGGTLGVTGASTLASASVTGAATVGTTLGVTGTTTLTGGVAGGRKRTANYQAASLTAGTDTTPVSGTVFYGELFLDANASLTGLGYLIGSVGGTDSAIVALYNAAGAVVANSALAGTVVGTTATYQEIAFTAPYAAKGPAQYFVSVSMNGTTARLRTIPAGAILPASSAVGVFGTLDALTPPTTFTADKAPIAYSY